MLLHECLLLLEFGELPLQMFVLVLLHGDLALQLVEVADDQRVDDLNVLVVERLQVVVQHGHVLPQTLDLLLVLPQDLLSAH